jgi:hypothetical protein
MRPLLLLLLATLSYSAQFERLTLAGLNEVIGSYDDGTGILTIATASGMLRAPYARTRIVSRDPISEQEVAEIWKKREDSAKEALARHETIAPLAVAPLSQPAPAAAAQMPAAAGPGQAAALGQLPPQLLQKFQQLPPQLQQQLQQQFQNQLPPGMKLPQQPYGPQGDHLPGR